MNSNMPNQKNEFMRRAIELSKTNVVSLNGGPFGAVIVKDNVIIGEGWNKVTTNNDPTAHAEVEAIRQACAKLKTFSLDDCEIYTSCEPCPMCLGAIYWARPARVYYANTKEDAAAIEFDDDFIYKEIEKPIHEREMKFIQVMRNEAQAGFAAWKNKTDKISY